MPQICPHCGATNRDTGRFCIQCRGVLPGVLGVGTLVQGRYQVVRKLGEGGFGAVYLANDTRLNTQLALKENFDSSQEAQEQFKVEAELLARLSHPNLPRVTDYFIDPSGRQYLVMDYIAGQDLENQVINQGKLPVPQAVEWIAQILDALDYMHSQNPPVIHRDIKPANIRVTPQNKAMLVDFGISKAASLTQRTALGARAVSPGFSPIEQYGGGRTEARSDIYSLGATLYCLLTGEVPPEPTDLLSMQTPLPMPTVFNPSIPSHVQDTILTAMKQRIEDRFSSARAMKRSLTFQPATAAPQYPAYPRAPTPGGLTQASPLPGAPQAAYPHAAQQVPQQHYMPPQQYPRQQMPQQQYMPQPMPQQFPMPAPGAIAGVPAGMVLADHGPRFLAWLIDGVLVSLLSGLCIGPLALIGALTESDDALAVFLVIGYILALFFSIRYYVRRHSRTGQTLGKKWMKIKVVGEDGALISKGKAFWRLVFSTILPGIIGGFTFGLGALVYLVPLFDSRRRALHDMICKTLVVQE